MSSTPININKLNQNVLEISISKRDLMNKMTCGCVYLSLAFNLIVILGLFIINNLIISLIIYNSIFSIIILILYYYNKTRKSKFKFDKENDELLKVKYVFGIVKSKKFKLSEIMHLNCKLDAIAGDFRYCIEIILQDYQKIKFWNTRKKNLALEYSWELSDFLGISCLYPLKGSKKQWR